MATKSQNFAAANQRKRQQTIKNFATRENFQTDSDLDLDMDLQNEMEHLMKRERECGAGRC